MARPLGAGRAARLGRVSLVIWELSPVILTHDKWSAAHREQAANLLVVGFRHQPDTWSDIDEAREEVQTFFDRPERRAWGFIEAGRLLGWVGAIEEYDGHVWELHPIVTSPSHRKFGFGRLLVDALESAARAAGVLTIQQGADDDFDGTSLSGVDLYADLPGAIAGATAGKVHPLEFYRKLGFVITGVIPDANGPGKPDILMSKRVSPA